MRVFTRLDIDRRAWPEGPVRVRPYAQTCHRGAVRPSVLLVAVDFIAGMVALDGADGDWVLTTEMGLRTGARPMPTEVALSGSLLRSGGNTVSTEIWLEADGEPFGYAQAGFTRIPRREGDPPAFDVSAFPADAEVVRLTRPFATEVGIEIEAPGRTSVALHGEIRNPAGAMQGSISALLAEVAAESLADAHGGPPQIVTDVDLRYLAMARTGPIAAHARWIARPEDRAIRVELRDRGKDDRTTATVLVRTADAP